MYMNIVSKASKFAIEKHMKQKRKDGITPYHKHLKDVADKLISYEITDTTTLASAWLHDVIEDTNTTFEDIRNIFGDKVAGYVDILTRNTTDELYLNRLRDAPFNVKMIKFCDIMSNLEDLPNSGLSDAEKIEYHNKKESIIMAILPDILENMQ